MPYAGDRLPPSPTLDRCKTGVLASFALLAGMQLDLFTPLGDGSLAARELAARLGVQPERLEPLLYGLAAMGLLTVEQDRFANTPEADAFLVRGRPYFIGDVCHLYEDLWRGALGAAESIRAGRPMAAHDYKSMSAEAVTAFFRGQHYDALQGGWRLAEAVDFADMAHVLEVGGGSGGLAIALCQRWPHLRTTLAELPSVAPVARRHIEEAGLSDRIDVVVHDILEQPMEGRFDAVILRSVLQVMRPADAGTTLRHLAPALAPAGSIYVLGMIVDDTRVSPEAVALFNLVFLSFYPHGRSFTEAEHRSWLEEAGFVDVERRLTANGLNMMVARAPG
jgi:ubiquinone/menaquinone biosynthesis C-methylase UbiE